MLQSMNSFFQTFAESDEPQDERLKSIIKSFDDSGQDEGDGENDCIVNTVWFNISVNLLTLLNTVQMGLEADHPEWADIWNICENVFTAGFALEMFIKLCVLRCRYFRDRANWLDGFLSVLGILDCWVLSVLGGNADLQSLSILRILRLMRLARILKLVRNFKPFVLVIQGVIGAISTTCYVFALLMIILYVFAIFFTERMGRGSAAEAYPGYSVVEDEIDEQEFMANYNPYVCWGSIPLSMLTLFNMAMMAEWTEIVRPIALKQPLYVSVFILFALLVAFSVMNVMIGSIVDSVFSESKRIDEALKQKVKSEKLAVLYKVQQLLSDMDTNKDNMIDETELQLAMQTSEVFRDLLSSINLPSGWSAIELLDMLDNSGDGMLQKHEFTTSFFRLMQSDDFQQICIMQSSINQVKHMIKDANQLFQDKFTDIESELGSIKAVVSSAKESQEDLAINQNLCDKASGEPCSEPGEEICGKRNAQVRQEDMPNLVDVACNEFKGRIEFICNQQVTETLDAAYKAFHKELENRKASLATQFIIPRAECLATLSESSTMVDPTELKSPVDHTNIPTGDPSQCTAAGDQCSRQVHFAEAESRRLPTATPEIQAGDPLQSAADSLQNTGPPRQCASGAHPAVVLVAEAESITLPPAATVIHAGDPFPSSGPRDQCVSSAHPGVIIVAEAESVTFPADTAKIHTGDPLQITGPDDQSAGGAHPAVILVAEAESITLPTATPEIHAVDPLQSIGPGDQCASGAHPAVILVTEPESINLLATTPEIQAKHSSQGTSPAVQCTSNAIHAGPADVKDDRADQAINPDSVPCHLKHEFTYDHSVTQLGFEIVWMRGQSPRVGRVMSNGASDVHGVCMGDYLTECNGISLHGRDRQQILQLLSSRPLTLTVVRPGSYI